MYMFTTALVAVEFSERETRKTVVVILMVKINTKANFSPTAWGISLLEAIIGKTSCLLCASSMIPSIADSWLCLYAPEMSRQKNVVVTIMDGTGTGQAHQNTEAHMMIAVQKIPGTKFPLLLPS